jgi:hypothetical protein
VSGGFCLHRALSALPAKVRKPFESLLAVGQIDAAALELVFTAGRLAGDTSRLLGFAVGYLYLQGKGVPVGDVIRMADQLNRRVNLSWSERRWRDEHGRLSRAVTLDRLVADDIRYELSAYELHLPAHWPGYLIRSSRRLGMEGLRQRHCVASYHEQIQRDRCAIAVVFLDRRRWTVQVFLTRDPERPLALGQIRTRDNARASPAVAEVIHERLGIVFRREAGDAPIQVTPRCYRENLRRLLPVLEAQGTKEVIVNFDGSGDSGSIWDIRFDPACEEDGPMVSILKLQSEFDREAGRWIQSTGVEDVPLKEAISTLTYDYLEETDVDWYNNDGGYGDLIISVSAGTVALNVHRRLVESTCEYSDAFEIATGDPL